MVRGGNDVVTDVVRTRDQRERPARHLGHDQCHRYGCPQPARLRRLGRASHVRLDPAVRPCGRPLTILEIDEEIQSRDLVIIETL